MRVKTGFVRHRRHKKVLARTRGMRMTRGRLYRVSKEADLHAGQYAYIGRRTRKRDMRRHWIQRINAGLATYANDIHYGEFINLLKTANVALNRKMLANLVLDDPETFKFIVSEVKRTQGKTRNQQPSKKTPQPNNRTKASANV